MLESSSLLVKVGNAHKLVDHRHVTTAFKRHLKIYLVTFMYSISTPPAPVHLGTPKAQRKCIYYY